jgi:hypothetical protein
MQTNRIVQVKFENELINLESALIVGKEVGGTKNTAMYVGSLDFDDIHSVLFYVNTSVLKILTGQMGIDLDDCDDFLLSAMSEAITKEWNVQNGHAQDVEMQKVVKFRRK